MRPAEMKPAASLKVFRRGNIREDEMLRKTAVIILLICFLTAISGCATAAKPAESKTPKQMKLEKEEGDRALLVQGIASFAGLVIGSLTGLFTAKKDSALTATLGGAVIGGGDGFGLGLIIYNNTKPGEKTADEKKVKEYFEEYRKIQLTDPK